LVLRTKAGARLVAALGVACLLSCAKPLPLSNSARLARTRADLERMFAGQSPIVGSIDLYGAMARAVTHNLEHRAQVLESMLEQRRLADTRLDLLPRLLANTEYYGRNNTASSFSRSIETGLTSLEPSTSQERDGWRTDLTLAFNVLDFGVSWVRAQQQANEAMIAEERRAKVAQDIVSDTRGAYWRAAGAEQLLPEVEELVAEVDAALDRARQLDDEGLVDPVSSASYRRSLLDKLRELAGLRRELELAQVELAQLMNVRPGGPLELVTPPLAELPVPDVDLPMEQLERDALVQRPELREEEYRLRINRLEVRRAMLSALPGLELRFGRNSDTNDFLTHGDWFSWSAVLTKNLVEIVTAPSAIGVARSDVEVSDARRLALSMAVLAQVHVAYRELRAAHEELRLAREVRQVEERLHDVIRDRFEAERESELELIRKRTDRVLADLRAWLAYADLQAAWGRLHGTTGTDPLRGLEGAQDVRSLAQVLRRSDERWRRRIEIARDYPDATIPAFPANLAD
jgi:outer membrane protein TolC